MTIVDSQEKTPCPPVLPLYVDVPYEAKVQKEDSDAGQLGDWTGFYRPLTVGLHDLKHAGPAPVNLLPFHKDH